MEQCRLPDILNINSNDGEAKGVNPLTLNTQNVTKLHIGLNVVEVKL